MPGISDGVQILLFGSESRHQTCVGLVSLQRKQLTNGKKFKNMRTTGTTIHHFALSVEPCISSQSSWKSILTQRIQHLFWTMSTITWHFGWPWPFLSVSQFHQDVNRIKWSKLWQHHKVSQATNFRVESLRHPQFLMDRGEIVAMQPFQAFLLLAWAISRILCTVWEVLSMENGEEFSRVK